MSRLTADFEVRYRNGPTIACQFSHAAQGKTDARITAIFGPSGCGKTTILRALAGLVRPHRGKISFGGETWFDSEKGISGTPRKRNVGFVFQDYALFPHKSVAGNIGYGLRQLARQDRRTRVSQLLQRMELVGLENRRPHQISGGQQQRVALARALARQPQLLLLDEPFAALDTPLRAALRRDLQRLLSELHLPVVIVSHDRDEVRALADWLLVMEEGRILQSGPTLEVLDHPASPDVARLAGFDNMLPAKIVSQLDRTWVQAGPLRLRVPPIAVPPAAILVCIRKEHLEIVEPDPGRESGENCVQGVLTRIDSEGHAMRLEVDCGIPLIVSAPARIAARMELRPGSAVKLAVAQNDICLVPRELP